MSADYAIRSSVSADKKELTEEVAEITEDFEGKWETFGDYPAWEYVKESPFRDKAIAVYKALYGEDPVVTGVHAGL